MTPTPNKPNRAAKLSLIFLLLSVVLFVINAATFGGRGVLFVLLETPCRLLAFVFAVVGIIRARNCGGRILLCVPGIVFPLISFGIFLAAFISEIETRTYTDTYLYDRGKNKIEYHLGTGFLEYNRHNIFSWHWYAGAKGNYYYTVYQSGLNGEGLPLPYCDWLYLHIGESNPMIGISGFCDYYHIYIEDDRENRRTIIYQLNDRLVLPWGKYIAWYEKSDETISLKFPTVYRENGDCHINADGSETFVDTDLLYYAGFLHLYDEEACASYFNYLYEKAKIIYKNGTLTDGCYHYKENAISGAQADFYNNALLEEAVIKIGMSADEALAAFDVPQKSVHKNCLAYPSFAFYYDENRTITHIYMSME